jgi:small subunit ribosomal protein S20
MPHRRSAVKKIRADKKRRLRNLRIKKNIKKDIKKFHVLLSAKNTDEAETLLKKIFSKLDKAAKKKVIYRNTCSRKKSQLSRRLIRTQLNK